MCATRIPPSIVYTKPSLCRKHACSRYRSMRWYDVLPRQGARAHSPRVRDDSSMEFLTVPEPGNPTFNLLSSSTSPCCAQAGGSIDVRRLECLEELAGYDLVVNCTGIRGAQQLFNDATMYPIRGQARCLLLQRHASPIECGMTLSPLLSRCRRDGRPQSVDFDVTGNGKLACSQWHAVHGEATPHVRASSQFLCLHAGSVPRRSCGCGRRGSRPAT